MQEKKLCRLKILNNLDLNRCDNNCKKCSWYEPESLVMKKRSYVDDLIKNKNSYYYRQKG